MDKEAPFVSSNTAKKKSTLVRNLIIAGAGIVLVAVGLILYFSLVKPAEKVSEAPDVPCMKWKSWKPWARMLTAIW